MKPFLILTTACIVLTACGTPEERQERSLCTAQWVQKIPVKIDHRLVTNQVRELRPTGKSTCVTEGNKATCQDEMEYVWVDKQEIEEFDANASQRQPHIEACVALTCTEKFGNSECKPRP